MRQAGAGRYLAALAYALLAWPVDGQFRVETWNTENGLPNSTVNSVLQTHDGFLWASTFGGLVRYDEARFEVFNTVNSKGIRTSRFENLFEDREGGLWATTEGQGVTRYAGGIFRTYTVADGLPDNDVESVFYGANDRLLVDTTKRMVEWRHGTFVPAGCEAPGFSDPSIAIMSFLPAGEIWYRDGATLLHKYERG